MTTKLKNEIEEMKVIASKKSKEMNNITYRFKKSGEEMDVISSPYFFNLLVIRFGKQIKK